MIIPGFGGSLSEGKQPSIGSGRKVISGIEILNDSKQNFMGSASAAGGSSLTNVAEGEKMIFIVNCVALIS